MSGEGGRLKCVAQDPGITYGVHKCRKPDGGKTNDEKRNLEVRTCNWTVGGGLDTGVEKGGTRAKRSQHRDRIRGGKEGLKQKGNGQEKSSTIWRKIRKSKSGNHEG